MADKDRLPMPKPGFKVTWKEPKGSGGTYKPRPMNVELGNDESPSSNYGADADKTFDKGRGTGTTGQTWSGVYKELKSGKKEY